MKNRREFIAGAAKVLGFLMFGGGVASAARPQDLMKVAGPTSTEGFPFNPGADSWRCRIVWKEPRGVPLAPFKLLYSVDEGTWTAVPPEEGDAASRTYDSKPSRGGPIGLVLWLRVLKIRFRRRRKR